MIHDSARFGMPAADAPVTASGPELGHAEFEAISAIMQRDARIRLSEGKMTLVHSRLSRRLRQHRLPSFRDYVQMVQNDAEERAAMVVALTTNHTHFFREAHHFDHFRQTVVPEFKAAPAGSAVRIWSAGCSSGEEVYTIAMCLLGQDRAASAWLRNIDIRLLATDLAPHVVESTQRASYAAATVEPIPAGYRSTWMTKVGDTYEMAKEARALVTAKVLNLFEPWPMRQAYDVIFCRNVMIYFDDQAKAELEARFVELLAPGGYLYIGHSERLIGAAAAQMTPCGQTIYRKQGGAR